MYKWISEAEEDSSGYEWVDENDRCENCEEKYKSCECGDVTDDDDPDAPFDELDYSR
jgi:hypothetical protein